MFYKNVATLLALSLCRLLIAEEDAQGYQIQQPPGTPVSGKTIIFSRPKENTDQELEQPKEVVVQEEEIPSAIEPTPASEAPIVIEKRASQKLHQIGMRHIEGGGIGYNQGYTTLEGFFPWLNREQGLLAFFDVRGHVFDNGKWASNLGIGVRHLARAVIGANAYYDYRQTAHHHYHQIGLGLELLRCQWEGRINGYLPVGAKKSSRYDRTSTTTLPVFDSFAGHYLITSQTTTSTSKVEFALKGVDGELGYHFVSRSNYDIYGALGPYYFSGYYGKQAVGGKARLAARFLKYFSVEGSYSYDKLFHGKLQGEVSFSIPFGPKVSLAKSQQCDLSPLSVQPVYRQEIIVTDREKLRKTQIFKTVAINPQTGLPYYFVFVNNLSSSLGTFESPYSTLAQAQSGSSPYDVIYVYPGDGTTNGMNQGFVMQNNQKLFGSGINQTLPLASSTLVIPAQSTTNPQLTANYIDANSSAVTLASTCEVSGCTFIMNGANGITGGDFILQTPPSLSGSLHNNQFIGQGFGGFGIAIVNVQGSTYIANNVFTDPFLSVQPMYLQTVASSQAASCVITGNSAFGGASGIQIQNSATSGLFSCLIKNNTLSNAGEIQFANQAGTSNCTAEDNNVTQSAIYGIVGTVNAGSLSIAVNRNTISNGAAFSKGVYLVTTGSGNLTGVVEGNAISNQQFGIQVEPISTGNLSAQVISNNVQGSTVAGIFTTPSNPTTCLNIE